MKKLIVIEGTDGAGTTTQAKRLHERLLAQGTDSFLTCQPTDGPIGSLIRSEFLSRPDARKSHRRDRALALMFAADRQMHIESLRDCDTVVSDRYLLSSWVYQGLSLPLEWIQELNANVPVPDLTILIDIDADLAARRRQSRGGVVELFDASDTARKIAARYRELIHGCPGSTAIIDGSGDADQVAIAIQGAIDQAERTASAGRDA